MLAWLLWLCGDRAALAQPPTPDSPVVAGGAGFPIAINSSTHEILSGRTSTSLAAWGEAVFPTSAHLSVHISAEIPSSFSMQVRHLGSAGFLRDIRHRDIVVAPMIGLRARGSLGVRPVGVVGLGVVFARTRSTDQPTGRIPPPAPFTFDTNKVLPALVGGLELPFMVSAHASLLTRIHARYVWRNNQFANVYIGALTITPSVGVQFGF
jgi:hypothetical protein